MPTLDWMTRGEDVRAADRVPYRLLEAQPELDGGDADAANMLIQGDNLDALKALLPYYAGRVKCIYIDPPYNTRSAFEHYDDNLEHSQWLAMIYPRLVLLRDLLAEDGSIWVSIDDNEGQYLKVVMDEVFGRSNFIVNAIWQKKVSPARRLGLVQRRSREYRDLRQARRRLATEQICSTDSLAADRTTLIPIMILAVLGTRLLTTCARTADEQPKPLLPHCQSKSGQRFGPPHGPLSGRLGRTDMLERCGEGSRLLGKRRRGSVPSIQKLLSTVWRCRAADVWALR